MIPGGYSVLRPRANDRGDARGPVLFLAIRGEHIQVHRRAERRRVDLILGHTRENQLVDVGAGDVEGQPRPVLRSAGRGWRQEPAVDEVALVAGGGECVHEVGPDLVATRSDAGADRNDEIGIQNTFNGRYRTVVGPGIYHLVRQVNPTLADETIGAMRAARSAIFAIPVPFDQAILGNDETPGRQAIAAAIAALNAQTDKIADCAEALGISISTT